MRFSTFIAVLAGCAAAMPAAAQDRRETITVDGSPIDVAIWDADTETPRGIVLFGHGWGGSPESYERIFESWSSRGYTVRAATFFDSLSYADKDKVDMNSMAGMQAIVGNRFNVISAERETAAETGLPTILGGHSFGALVAQYHAEGQWPFGPIEGPDVAGVMVFSSPGAVPMLVTPTSYTTIDLPYMMITGTADNVGAGGQVWEEHRLGFDRSKEGDKTLVVVKDGGHNLVAFKDEGEEQLFEPISTLTGLFLDAFAGGDEMAATALGEVGDTELLAIERR